MLELWTFNEMHKISQCWWMFQQCNIYNVWGLDYWIWRTFSTQLHNITPHRTYSLIFAEYQPAGLALVCVYVFLVPFLQNFVGGWGWKQIMSCFLICQCTAEFFLIIWNLCQCRYSMCQCLPTSGSCETSCCCWIKLNRGRLEFS